MSRPAIFLDRDGVLNECVTVGGLLVAPRTLGELRLAQAAATSVAALRAHGFVTVIVTNQPDVARGDLPRETADAINDAVLERSGADALYACFHGGEEKCECRKPRPGMLLRAADELDLDLAASWLIGDRWVDIAAAAAAGVRAALVEHAGSWEPTSAGSPPADLEPAFRGDLEACVERVLGG